MNLLTELLLAGLANGAIYASLGLAVSIIYQGSGQINFAQGEMATLSTYLAWTLLQLGLPYWWSFAATVTASLLAGVLLQRLLLARLRGDDALTPVAVYIGLYLFCHGFTGWRWGHSPKAFPSPFPDVALGGLLSAHELGVIVFTLLLMLLLHGFLTQTILGLALRAAAQKPLLATLLGVPVEFAAALSWGAAAALGAIAGMLIAPLLFLHPQMLSGVLIYSFAGAVLGGLGNPSGAVIGGVFIGIAEALIGAYLPFGSDLKLSLAFLLIVSLLWLRPNGLFAAG